MLSYCLKYKKVEQIKNPEVIKTKNERIMIFSKYSVFNSKKSRS